MLYFHEYFIGHFVDCDYVPTRWEVRHMFVLVHSQVLSAVS